LSRTFWPIEYDEAWAIEYDAAWPIEYDPAGRLSAAEAKNPRRLAPTASVIIERRKTVILLTAPSGRWHAA
jgi:hypothetical protein